MLQIKGLQVTDGSVSSLKVVPTGVVQEMRCAGSLSLQAWGAQRSAKAGCGEEEHLRISVVQAGGQWLAGGTHKKKHRNDGKIRAQRNQRNVSLPTSECLNMVFKSRVQERPKDPQNYPDLSVSVSCAGNDN